MFICFGRSCFLLNNDKVYMKIWIPKRTEILYMMHLYINTDYFHSSCNILSESSFKLKFGKGEKYSLVVCHALNTQCTNIWATVKEALFLSGNTFSTRRGVVHIIAGESVDEFVGR